MRLKQLFAFGIAFCLAAALPAMIALSLTPVLPSWDAQGADSGFTSPRRGIVSDTLHPHRMPPSPASRRPASSLH